MRYILFNVIDPFNFISLSSYICLLYIQSFKTVLDFNIIMPHDGVILLQLEPMIPLQIHIFSLNSPQLLVILNSQFYPYTET